MIKCERGYCAIVEHESVIIIIIIIIITKIILWSQVKSCDSLRYVAVKLISTIIMTMSVRKTVVSIGITNLRYNIVKNRIVGTVTIFNRL